MASEWSFAIRWQKKCANFVSIDLRLITWKAKLNRLKSDKKSIEKRKKSIFIWCLNLHTKCRQRVECIIRTKIKQTRWINNAMNELPMYRKQNEMKKNRWNLSFSLRFVEAFERVFVSVVILMCGQAYGCKRANVNCGCRWSGAHTISNTVRTRQKEHLLWFWYTDLH